MHIHRMTMPFFLTAVTMVVSQELAVDAMAVQIPRSGLARNELY